MSAVRYVLIAGQREIALNTGVMAEPAAPSPQRFIHLLGGSMKKPAGRGPPANHPEVLVPNSLRLLLIIIVIVTIKVKIIGHKR
jgi:hypothetical protein